MSAIQSQSALIEQVANLMSAGMTIEEIAHDLDITKQRARALSVMALSSQTGEYGEMTRTQWRAVLSGMLMEVIEKLAPDLEQGDTRAAARTIDAIKAIASIQGVVSAELNVKQQTVTTYTLDLALAPIVQPRRERYIEDGNTVEGTINKDDDEATTTGGY